MLIHVYNGKIFSPKITFNLISFFSFFSFFIIIIIIIKYFKLVLKQLWFKSYEDHPL